MIYIGIFVLVYNKGYQEFDDVLASVSTKVKGYSFANKTIAGDFPGIWDVADYTVPPQENNAIFVTTNAILTYDQEQTKCPEAVSAKDFCNNDEDCAPMTTKAGGNGVRTGKCVNSSQSENKVCEIYSWCPLENDTLTGTPLLTSAENFTLFVKNNILFPKFGVSRKNVPPNLTCQYDAINNTLCPVFRLGTLKDVVRAGGIASDAQRFLDRGIKTDMTTSVETTALIASQPANSGKPHSLESEY
ncbi:P2RX4 [Acanthosepion pharaonis]|uniref:P2RX4 n=1 Tax=Acanthosepion pharaonis TaxID=158019 RepID=A0A812EE55_ACAPH|nr:P2RX4 [Sepia pharaonis]